MSPLAGHRELPPTVATRNDGTASTCLARFRLALKYTKTKWLQTTAAPLKRGRRGAGSGLEEGGHSSRGGGGKARRSNSHGADDDGGDQVLLRDRRSRIAARALRSNGNVFDIGAIVKGITARKTESEQPEELRVVRVAERDVVVDPPAVPAGLMKFLTKREERIYQEVRRVVVQLGAREGMIALNDNELVRRA